MQQLSGLDASFLYLETPNTPMHIGSLCIYDQSTAPGGHVRFKDILAFYEERLHRAKVFRRRLARVPFALDHPYWIEDPDFDLEFHVRHIALPAPGDWRQLCIQTSRLHARPIDLNRPLWEVYVIEGLDAVEGVPKGSFAVVSKVHHAAIDGVSGSEIAAALHDLSPVAEVPPPNKDWIAEREPTEVELIARTAARTASWPLRVGRVVKDGLPAVGRLVGGYAKKELAPPVTVPRTRFNGNVTSHRVFDGRSFPLDDIRAMKKSQPGTTVNDVVVTICGGALRKYLQAKHELPEESLVAMAPMSVRGAEERRSEGNLVSALSLPVRSDIEDPLERLYAVHDASINAKKTTYALGPEMTASVAEFLPSTTSGMLMRAYSRLKLAETFPPIYNTVITNVPGVNLPLYSMGSKMVANFGLGPAVHGVGLFQPVLSYNNQITISAVSCREMMPDPSFYMECLQASFDELKDVTIGEGAAKRKAEEEQARKDNLEAAAAAEKKQAAQRKKKASKKKPAKKKTKKKAASKRTAKTPTVVVTESTANGAAAPE
ncbi:MAG: wax ester/triacylglycerol synthase family O-acyltransferase [Pseudomonadota bacterium]